MMEKIHSPFVCLPYKCSSDKVERYLFCKIHEADDESIVKPSNRTLLVLNIPQYFTEELITAVFERCGAIEKIYFHKRPTISEYKCGESESIYFTTKDDLGYHVGYVVFSHPTSLKKALKLHTKGVRTITVDKEKLNIGVRKWANDYNSNIPNVSDLQEAVESYVANYDKSAEQEKKAALEVEGIPDEDGWITVTKQSKKTKVPRAEVSSKLAERQKKQQSKRTLLNFYRFQVRESNSEQIAQLRKKFEEDKKKIAAMKANRKFKPY